MLQIKYEKCPQEWKRDFILKNDNDLLVKYALASNGGIHIPNGLVVDKRFLYDTFVRMHQDASTNYVVSTEDPMVHKIATIAIGMFAPSPADKALIIDLHNVVHRAWHALGGTANDNPNFLKIYLANILLWSGEHGYNHIFVATDSGFSLREKIAEKYGIAYKKNRRRIPEYELIRSKIIEVESFLTRIGVRVVKEEGYEADDIVAGIAHKCNQKNVPFDIVSTDKDLFQLYSLHDFLFIDPLKRFEQIPASSFILAKMPDVANLILSKTITVLDYLSLVGDSSDGIPGFPKIGPKTASKILHEESFKSFASRMKQENLEGYRLMIGSRKLAALYSHAFVGEYKDGFLYIPKAPMFKNAIFSSV